MALDRNTGEFITLDEAKVYVSDFRKGFLGQPKGFFAGANKINEILAQPGCIGIRIYNGYDDKGQNNNLVILGIDEGERDMTEGLILERIGLCPPNCDVQSALS